MGFQMVRKGVKKVIREGQGLFLYGLECLKIGAVLKD